MDVLFVHVLKPHIYILLHIIITETHIKLLTIHLSTNYNELPLFKCIVESVLLPFATRS